MDEPTYYRCPMPGCRGLLREGPGLERSIQQHERTEMHVRAAEVFALYSRMLKGIVPPMDGAREQSIAVGK